MINRRLRTNPLRSSKWQLSALGAAILAATSPMSLAQDDNRQLLEEIIVTATRSEQNIQDIASTVNVVTGDRINELNLFQFEDLERVTSGLQLTQVNTRTATITLRGITFSPESGAAPAVDPYVNNVVQRGDDVFVALYDLDRVEVLRGPQGALQGTTSPAGTIQLHTAKPDLEKATGHFRGTYGETNEQRNIQGAISVPLIENQLAARLAFFSDENDGKNIVNRVTGNVQDQSTDSYRLSVLWSPNENFEASFMYQDTDKMALGSTQLAGSRNSASAFAGVAGLPCAFVAPSAAASCTTLSPSDNAALSAADEFTTLESEIITLNADWTFGNHRLSYVFGQTDAVKTSRTENDRTSNLPLQNAFFQLALGVANDTDYLTHQGTQTVSDLALHELRISSVDNPVWNYTFGLFYRDLKTTTAFESWSTSARYLPLANLNFTGGFFPNGVVPIPANPNLVIPGLFPNGLPAYQLQFTGGDIEGINFSTGGSIPVNSETTAFFTAHSFQLNENTVIEAALRYQEIDRFRQSDILFGSFNQEANISIQNLSATSNNPLLNAALPAVINGTAQSVAQGTLAGTLAGIRGINLVGISPANQSPSDDSITGTLAIRHDFNDDLSAYASYNRSYRAGSTSIVPGTALPESDILYGDESSDAIEVGFKATYLDGAAEVNGAFFYQTFDGFLGRITELQADADANPATTNDIAQFPGGLVFNGDATFAGVELDWRWAPSSSWLLGGAMNYTRAEWDGANAPCNDRVAGEVVGRCPLNGRIAGSPEFSANTFSEYRIPVADMEFFARGNAKYQGGIVSTAAARANMAPAETGSYIWLDLYAGLRQDRWEISAWVKNLLDENEHIDILNPGDNFDINQNFVEVRLLQERTVGLTGAFNF